MGNGSGGSGGSIHPPAAGNATLGTNITSNGGAGAINTSCSAGGTGGAGRIQFARAAR